MMEGKNRIRVELDAISENESLARVIAGAFLVPFNPTVEEMEDVKTAVCEAVTNCIIHGYENKEGTIILTMEKENGVVSIEVEDRGVGIPDVKRAIQPLFTTKPEQERSGMGFSFMEAFMDEVSVESKPGVGTKVTLKKNLNEEETKADTCECP